LKEVNSLETASEALDIDATIRYFPNTDMHLMDETSTTQLADLQPAQQVSDNKVCFFNVF
jgi:hypothetical protein